MKKRFTLLLILTFISILSAEPFFEDFSAAYFPPDGWTVGPHPWYRETNLSFCYSAPASARTGNVQWDTYWLISPRLYPTSEANILTFWYRDHEAGYIWDYQDEYTYVMVSTQTNNYLHFTDVVWTGGWDDFGLSWQQAQIDLSAYNGQSIYIGFKHVSTGGNIRYIDDVSGLNLALVPPDDPENFSATTMGDTAVQLNWLQNSSNHDVMVAFNTEDSFGTPRNGQIYAAGDSVAGGGEVIYNGEATEFLHGGLNPATGYYYRAWSVQEIAEEIIYSLGVGTELLTPGPVCHYPWGEGFELENTSNSSVVAWTQQSISGSGGWNANNSTTPNRSPRTGFWNACLYRGNSDWLFKELQLDANCEYTLELWAKQDGYNVNNVGLSVAFGTAATADSMTNIIVPQTGIQRLEYQELCGTFSPPVSGAYYLGICGLVNSPSYYLSIDDISISAETALGIPILAIGHDSNSDLVLLTWEPVEGAEWYAVYVSDDPSSEFGPAYTDPLYIVTDGNSLEVSATEYSKNFYLITAGSGDQP